MTGCNNHLIELHNYNYEVLINASIQKSDSGSHAIRVHIYSDKITMPNDNTGRDCFLHAAAKQFSNNSFAIPAKSKIYLEISNSDSSYTSVVALGYRRIGSNS